MARERLIELFHKHLDNKGYNNVRSLAKGNDSPPIFSLKPEDITLKPDVSAEIRGKKLVYEFVEAQPTQKQYVIDKCRHYLKAAQEGNFKVRLIVPLDRYDAVLQWINAHQLDQVGLVRVNMRSALN